MGKVGLVDLHPDFGVQVLGLVATVFSLAIFAVAASVALEGRLLLRHILFLVVKGFGWLIGLM